MVDFEKEGVLSIWVGTKNIDSNIDILKELCGVDYYDVDFQDCIVADDCQETNIENLIKRLSYAESYCEKAVSKAKSRGLDKAIWVTMQFDFAYDPSLVTRPIADNPIFLGVFEYVDDDN